MKIIYTPLTSLDLKQDTIYFDRAEQNAIRLKFIGVFQSFRIFKVLEKHPYHCLNQKECLQMKVPFQNNLIAFQNALPFFRKTYSNL